MDNSITVKVVFRSSSKSKKSGTLYIRTTSNRKSKFKSLGIQLKKSHWDADAQRVLPSLKKDFKLYNGIIEDSLAKLKKGNDDLESLKQSRISILEFWENHNATTRNAGTTSIRISSLKKFRAFLTTENKSHLKFQELNPNIVQKYYNYLSRELNPRSTKTYFGYFKSVVKQAIKQQVINTYPVDPFINVSIPSFKNKKAKALTVEQVKNIMNCSLPDTRSYYRNMFCFQVLGGGLRIRDMIMLKWENIFINDKGIYLIYTQSKTGKQITSKLSHKALGYLLPILNRAHPKNVVSIMNILKWLNTQLNLRAKWENNNKFSRYDTTTMVEFQHYDFKEGKKYKIDEIPKSEAERITIDENINMYTHDLLQEYNVVLHDLIQSRPEEYIFDLLKNLNIPSNGHLSVKENRQVQGQIAKYNYHLKKICEILSIPKITSHQARHSFTQMLVNNNTNLYFVQQMLGHSSLKVTQNYVASLHTTQLDEISDTIARQF